jgi:hypothetical protein
MADLDKLKQDLQRARDEIALQVELASMEAREQWEPLEKLWGDFQDKAKLEESADSISGALSLLGDELSNGYKKIKKAIDS